MPRIRSREEIVFRLRQETSNLYSFFRPKVAMPVVMRPLLPSAKEVAQELRGSPFDNEVMEIAEQVLEHRFPLLGVTLETGPEIHWRRDYASGIETGLKYYRLIPYLDAARAGDHKNIWELNRHQHLVLLAQAGLLSGQEKYWQEIQKQLSSWFEHNPYGRGINWTSALEVGFRAISWIWLLHLGRDHFSVEERKRLTNGLFQHASHLEKNLSVYFSPNTHLLGEAVALHAIGTLFPGWQESAKWVELGGRIVAQEMQRQVLEDGAHFEQSTYYHVYAVDMFLFHAVICETNPYAAKLRKMAEYLESLMGPARKLSFLGDDDGGRFFHPYGTHDQFGRGTLAACSKVLKLDLAHDYEDLFPQAVWLLGKRVLTRPLATGPRASRIFRNTGMASLVCCDAHLLFDVGTFGPGAAGHSHADALSITLRFGVEELFVDAGTFTYVGDLKERDRFRGTGAHNTIRIDQQDQATATRPFAWEGRPEVELLEFKATDEEDFVVAESRYKNFRHRRRLLFRKREGLILIGDFVAGGSDGEYAVEQIWHAGETVNLVEPGVFQIGKSATLQLAGNTEFAFDGWRSRVFGQKEHNPIVRQTRHGKLPIVMPVAISLLGKKNITFQTFGDAVEFSVEGTVFRLG